jgi:hypothetical protein
MVCRFLGDSMVPRRLSAFRCVAAGESTVSDLYLGSQGKRLAHRAQVCLEQAPASGLFVVRVGTTGSANERALIGIDASGRIGARAGGTGELVHGPTLEPGRWYRIDLIYDLSDENNYTLDWQLDGVQQLQATYKAGVAAGIVTVGVGYEGTASSGCCYFKPHPITGGRTGPIALPYEPSKGLTPPIVPSLLRTVREAPRHWAQDARLLLLDLTRPTRESGCTARTKHCEFWNWGADADRPDCCTDHLKELAFFLEDLLTRHGITHWLDFGALLGAVRDGELIPWDSDVDLGILDGDVEAVHALVPEIRAAGYHVVRGTPPGVVPSSIYVLFGPRNWNHVSLYTWRERDGWLEEVFDDPPWPWPGMRRTRFPSSYLESFEQVRFYGKPFPAPSPVHRLLREHRYGADYMSPRRPVLDYKLVPEISPDAVTPGIAELIDRIAEADARLLERVSRTRLFRLRRWQEWVAMGLPDSGDEDNVKRLRRAKPDLDSADSITEALVRTLALLQRALEEYEERGGGIRRARRRLGWFADAVVGGVRGRPRRALFPFMAADLERDQRQGLWRNFA